MGRMARVVCPGLPHHVTQRGKRRQRTFFCDEDYQAYRALMRTWCGRRGVAVWGYLLGSTAADFPEAMNRHEATGRPLVGRSFVQELEAMLVRTLLPRKPGSKPKAKQEAERN